MSTCIQLLHVHPQQIKNAHDCSWFCCFTCPSMPRPRNSNTAHARKTTTRMLATNGRSQPQGSQALRSLTGWVNGVNGRCGGVLG
jgi:hypothetical protein